VTRQLLLLRHAKSAWPPGAADADRPLAPRGERACTVIGAYLARQAILPDHVAVSPAQRTRETAQRVLAAASCPAEPVIEPQLYEGDPFLVLREVPDHARCAMLVGHEPELLELVRVLCGADVRLPTAALALLELEAPWALQPAGRGVLQLLVTPKLLAGVN